VRVPVDGAIGHEGRQFALHGAVAGDHQHHFGELGMQALGELRDGAGRGVRGPGVEEQDTDLAADQMARQRGLVSHDDEPTCRDDGPQRVDQRGVLRQQQQPFAGPGPRRRRHATTSVVSARVLLRRNRHG